MITRHFRLDQRVADLVGNLIVNEELPKNGDLLPGIYAVTCIETGEHRKVRGSSESELAEQVMCERWVD